MGDVYQDVIHNGAFTRAKTELEQVLSDGTSKEGDMYGGLAAMCNAVLDPAAKRINEKDVTTLYSGDHSIVSSYVVRKPDMVLVPKCYGVRTLRFGYLIDDTELQNPKRESDEQQAPGHTTKEAITSSSRRRTTTSNTSSGRKKSNTQTDVLTQKDTRENRDLELQLASYAAEMCSVGGDRIYSMGLLVKNSMVYLRYRLPSYLVCSDGIDFTDNFQPLANLLMLFATKPLTEQGGLGFNIKTGYINPFNTHVEKTWSMSFRVNVLNPTNKWKEVRVQKGEHSQSAYSLLGRGTAVYRATLDVDKDPRTPKVVKTSWQVVGRKKEHEIILDARKIDSKHVVQILGYGVEVDDSPTATLISGCTTKSEIQEIKELRILIERKYKPIHTITDQKIFLDVFMQCVICAHELYSRCDILHGDISINNLAYYIDDENRYIGVLMDFDLASIGRSGPSSHIRSGTAPFMARDLLDPSKDSYTHEFHHDLESFLYVLMWYTLGYTGNVIPKDDPLFKFRRGSSRDMLIAKKGYFAWEWEGFFPNGYTPETDPLRFSCYSLSVYLAKVAISQQTAKMRADEERQYRERGIMEGHTLNPPNPELMKVTFKLWLKHMGWDTLGLVCGKYTVQCTTSVRASIHCLE